MKFIIICILLAISSFSYSQSITISAIGDIMAHDTLQEYALSTQNGYLTLFDNTKHIFLNDDLTIGNLETPICDSLPIMGFPKFNAKSSYVDALKLSGIDVVSLANNHSFDQSYEGVRSTIDNVKKRQILFSGTGLSKNESLTPVILNVKGVIVGYFSGTFSLNGLLFYEKENFPYINYFPIENEKSIQEFTDIIKKTKKNVDIMIVSYHSGDEYQSTPNSLQEKTLKMLADSGADIVLNHHPHVLQKIEYYTANDGRNTLIAYSLGNFISSQSRNLSILSYNCDWMYDSTLTKTAEGIILQFDIIKWDNSFHIINPRIIPTYNINFLVKNENRYYNGYDTLLMENIIKYDNTSDLRFSKNLDNIKKLMVYRYNKIKNLINLPVSTP